MPARALYQLRSGAISSIHTWPIHSMRGPRRTAVIACAVLPQAQSSKTAIEQLVLERGAEALRTDTDTVSEDGVVDSQSLNGEGCSGAHHCAIGNLSFQVA
jgi:hypothetical protein